MRAWVSGGHVATYQYDHTVQRMREASASTYLAVGPNLRIRCSPARMHSSSRAMQWSSTCSLCSCGARSSASCTAVHHESVYKTAIQLRGLFGPVCQVRVPSPRPAFDQDLPFVVSAPILP
jgi:hypothetical protein